MKVNNTARELLASLHAPSEMTSSAEVGKRILAFAAGDALVADTILQIAREIHSETCAVCGGKKWLDFPFCRSCSIRVQRIHFGQVLHRWTPSSLAGWRAYDRMRDYLMNSNRRDAEVEV